MSQLVSDNFYFSIDLENIHRMKLIITFFLSASIAFSIHDIIRIIATVSYFTKVGLVIIIKIHVLVQRLSEHTHIHNLPNLPESFAQ